MGLNELAELIQGLEVFEVLGLHLVTELILDQHNDVHYFQRVDAQVLFEAGVAAEFIFFDFQVFYQECAYFLVNLTSAL